MRGTRSTLLAVGLSFALAFAFVTSCSLFVSVDGLEDGDGVATSDGASQDSGFTDGNAPIHDSGSDATVFAGDAGKWAFVSSDGRTVEPDGGMLGTDLVTSSTTDVQAGDLVIFGCDTGFNAGFITFGGIDPGVLTLDVVGPRSDGENYEAEMGWGVVQSPIANLSLTGTVQNPASAGFMDCTVNVYRGGGPNVSLVDSEKVTGPDDSGNATCGPIQTAPGGVAYYISARTFCIGPPYDPAFTQRQPINGNPNGDVVPTDGGIVESEMMPCSNSTGSWICYMMSLTP